MKLLENYAREEAARIHPLRSVTTPSTVVLKGRWRYARQKMLNGIESAQDEWEQLDKQLRERLAPEEYAAFAVDATPSSPKTATKPEWPKRLWSAALNDHVWIVRNEFDARQVPDGAAYYTEQDIRLLKGSTPDHLRAVHEARKVFPGGKLL